MYSRLSSLIKEFKGNVLVIGLDDKLIDYFNKNSSINLYSISRDNLPTVFKKSSKMKNNKGKNINIKRLKRYINFKSIDYLMTNSHLLVIKCILEVVMCSFSFFLILKFN